MRIHKIEIEKFRGVKKLTLEPEGKSMVVFGPNGSGKSAIVDAVDFLLTGKISRLEGEGSSELSTKRHGPHVDHSSKEAIVRAEVEVKGEKNRITLERRISDPNKIICKDEYADLIAPALNVAGIGQHKLSRREILKYIMATAGDRASEIHALLDLEIVDKTRKVLVATRNAFEKEFKSASDAFDKTKTEIRVLLGIEEFSESECLKHINDQRRVLRAADLSKLTFASLKEGIEQPTGKSEDDVKNWESLKRGIGNIRELLANNKALLTEVSSAKSKVREFMDDIELFRNITQRKLVELGLSLIDDSNACPLCGVTWDETELKKHLQARLEESKKGNEKVKVIKEDAEKVRKKVIEYKNTISTIAAYYKTLGLVTYKDDLESLSIELDLINKILLEPIENNLATNKTTEDLFNSSKIEELNEKIGTEISSIKYEASPQLKSWTVLTKLEVLLGQYKDAQDRFANGDSFFNRSNAVLAHFEKARDEVLQSIFNNVNTDFDNFYKELHGDDEKDFASTFVPNEAELLLEVDFYGRGKFHPGAMHSEGHQDSMGLCLFLGLHKYLAKDNLSLVVLDDVVMSVDAKHRRNVCKTLLTHFPDKQFIITTHDRIWANQLKTEGVVNSKNMVEFRWWSIETGPATWTNEDFWKDVIADATKGEVPQAAWKLRRNGECFLNDACDLMQAHVIFKSDGNWELGDYLYAAIKQYNYLLSKAKDAANSWNNRDVLEYLGKYGDSLGEAIKKTQCEQWAVNPNIHYSKWPEFQPADFKPVVEAFQNLLGKFICEKCRHIPQLLVSKDKTPEALKCVCGTFNWNLRLKDKK